MVRTSLRTGALAGILALAATGAANAQTAVQAAPASATAARVQFQRSISSGRFDVPATVQVGPSYRTQPGKSQGRKTRGVWTARVVAARFWAAGSDRRSNRLLLRLARTPGLAHRRLSAGRLGVAGVEDDALTAFVILRVSIPGANRSSMTGIWAR